MRADTYYWHETLGVLRLVTRRRASNYMEYQDPDTQRIYVLHDDTVEELNAMEVLARSAASDS